jgi:hypothetical protein
VKAESQNAASEVSGQKFYSDLDTTNTEMKCSINRSTVMPKPVANIRQKRISDAKHQLV